MNKPNEHDDEPIETPVIPVDMEDGFTASGEPKDGVTFQKGD